MKSHGRLTRSFLRALLALVVASGCSEPPTEPEPTDASFVLTATELSFSALEGGANPDAGTVAITNGGERQLTRISTSVVYEDAATPSWLEVSLDRTTAPASLRVAVATDGLEPSVHRATIRLTGSGGATDASIPVELTLEAAPDPARIDLSASRADFSARFGGTDPAEQWIEITNGGEAALEGLSVSVRYADEPPVQWLAAALEDETAPTRLALGASIDELESGSWLAEVELSAPGAENDPAVIDVQLDIQPPEGPWVSVSGTTVDFTARSKGRFADTVAIQIENIGTGLLGGLSHSVTYDDASDRSWLRTTWSDDRTPATLKLSAWTGLDPGTYTAELAVTSHTGLNRPTVSVTYEVLPGPSITPESEHVHWVATRGGPNTHSVEVLGSDGQPLSGLAVERISYQNSGIPRWLVASISSPTSLLLEVDTLAVSSGYHSGTVWLVSDSTSGSHTLPVTVALDQPLPDYVPEGPLTVGATAEAGGQLSVDEFHIVNQGPGAGALKRGFFFSTDAVIDTTDTGYCSRHIGLEPGERKAIGPEGLSVPQTMTPGTYHVGLIINCDGRLEEDLSNNVLVSASPVTITAPPEATLTLRAEPADGGRLISSPAGPTFPKYSDVTLTAIANPGYRFTGFQHSRRTWPETTHVVTAFSDYEYVAEFTRIEDLPDLVVVGSLTADAAVRAGDSLQVSAVSVVNVGGGRSEELTHRYVLSRDRTITREDIRLDDERTYQRLTAGASTTIAARRLKIPGRVTPGRYYVGLITDFYDDFDHAYSTQESDETNNTAVSDVTIEVLEPRRHRLTTVVDGIGGRILVDPELDDYPTDMAVGVEAVPDPGYELVAWDGEPGWDKPHRWVRMTSDTTVTARFGIMKPELDGRYYAHKVELSWTFEWRCAVRTRSGCLPGRNDRYEVEERLVSSDTWSVVYTSETTGATEYSRSFTRPPGSYYYRVRALGDGWVSPWSRPAWVSVPDPAG